MKREQEAGRSELCVSAASVLQTLVKEQTHIIKLTESHGGTSLKNVMDCIESLTLTDVRFGTLSR